MLGADYGIIATGKREYKDDKYPAKYYVYTKYGQLINVLKDTYDTYDAVTELEIAFYEKAVYIKERTKKGVI